MATKNILNSAVLRLTSRNNVIKEGWGKCIINKGFTAEDGTYYFIVSYTFGWSSRMLDRHYAVSILHPLKSLKGYKKDIETIEGNFQSLADASAVYEKLIAGKTAIH